AVYGSRSHIPQFPTRCSCESFGKASADLGCQRPAHVAERWAYPSSQAAEPAAAITALRSSISSCACVFCHAGLHRCPFCHIATEPICGHEIMPTLPNFWTGIARVVPALVIAFIVMQSHAAAGPARVAYLHPCVPVPQRLGQLVGRMP